MSAEAVGWVYRYSPYRGAAFAVHLAIADSVNDQHGNEFWMLETRLAKKARTSRASASRAVQDMLVAGLLLRLEGPVKANHPARFSFVFKQGEVVYDTRLTTSRVRASPVRDTRLTSDEHAPHHDAQIPIEPKMNPNSEGEDKPRAASKRSSFPLDWTPDETERAVATAAGMDATTRRAEFQKFKDHHLAHGKQMADWSAAWRTWCHNWRSFGGRAAVPDDHDSRVLAGLA